MNITHKLKRICRSGGGWHVGVRWHFYTNIWDGPCAYNAPDYVPSNTRYRWGRAEIGLLFWEWHWEWEYHHEPLPPEDT